MTDTVNGQAAAPPAAPAAAAPGAEAAAGEKECAWCERMPGAVAVFAAAVIGYIGLDLLTRGALSRLLFGGRQAREEAQGEPQP